MTRRRFALAVDEEPTPADVAAIVARLRAFNEERTGRPLRMRKFAVYVRDGGGAIVGGCIAVTYWDWLYIDYLWLDEGLRNRGWGGRMLERAERIAARRGCRGAWLDTFSFQAPGFYRRMGYRELGVMKDHPRGESRHFFWKPLRRSQARRTPARRR
jgi:ribosomal protein S18 acetylase RimI-like enzyme